MWETFGFEFVNFYLIPGLVLGCIYALGAIGITLTFSILRFANFAHGEVMMIGCHVGVTSKRVLATLCGVHRCVAVEPGVFGILRNILGYRCDLGELIPARSANLTSANACQGDCDDGM